MKTNIYAIWDSKAEFYKYKFEKRHHGEALRELQSAVNHDKGEIAEHPEDFTLFYLGTYDDCTGKFENEKTPVSLGLAIEYVKNKVTENEKDRGAVVVK